MRNKFTLRRLFALLFLVCFVLLFINESKLIGPSRITFSSFFPSDLLIEDSWYGIYLQDTLVGYSHFFMKAEDVKKGGGYILNTISQFELPILGSMLPLTLNAEIALTSQYSLRKADIRLRSKLYSFLGSLKRKDADTYILSIKSPAQNVTREISEKKGLIHPLFTPLSLHYIPLQKNVSFSFYDPFLDRESKVSLENKGKKTVEWEGEPKEVFLVDMDMEGMRGTLLVDAKGKVLQEEFLGFKIVKENPSALLKKSSPPQMEDLIQNFAVVSDVPINAPDVRYLKLNIEGLPSGMIREDFNQKVTPHDNGVTVEIFKKEPTKVESLPFSGEEFKQYLKEEEFIQFNTPLMEKTVHSIISDEKDPLVILEKLFYWIRENVTITPTISFPNTLDVLKLKQGDCGELSALLVGFLRRLGIPAYVNIGLVYLDGIFYYHAWVSVYVGEWIDTDPALRQLIADATHIKLFQGLRGQFEIPKIIGNVKINVVEYR